MMPSLFASLDFARHCFYLQAQEDARLPAFLGSTLRGSFGHALKMAVCLRDSETCAETCRAAGECAYASLFETPTPPGNRFLRGQPFAPHPFVLGVAPPSPADLFLTGMTCTFTMTLLGRAAIPLLPAVVCAVRLMAWRGLGAHRAPFALVAVTRDDGAASSRSVAAYIEERIVELGAPAQITLRFQTPTRLRVRGDLQTDLSFETLVRSLLRRAGLLVELYGGAPLALDFGEVIAQAATIETRRIGLEWHDWERSSSRKQTRMLMGGLIGDIEYAGAALADLLPLVLAGELMHVGTGTSFGMGRYRAE